MTTTNRPSTIRTAPQISPADCMEQIRTELVAALRAINDARGRSSGTNSGGKTGPAKLNSNQVATLNECVRMSKRVAGMVKLSVR